MPVSLDLARAAVSWPAVLGVMALLVVAVAVFAVRVGAARAAAQPRPAEVAGSTGLTRTAPPSGFTATGPSPSAVPTSTAPAGPGQGASSPGSSAGLATARVVVDVAGLVVRPGVRTLPPGARVTDALAAAGGARPGADLTRVNLARPLVDG
ncbi:MAG: SLBB domain-containing protein, partial [Actinomycetota bacterium]|nr:SLBB domain-containing protein [Actinomycetota bacterium]